MESSFPSARPEVDSALDKSGPSISSSPRTKDPPPERPENIRTRRFVILSFWAIVVFLGLPVWWRTTAIYRANLPLEQMTNWADGKVSYHKHDRFLYR